jgi:hypothetical protein
MKGEQDKFRNRVGQSCVQRSKIAHAHMSFWPFDRQIGALRNLDREGPNMNGRVLCVESKSGTAVAQ